MRKITIAENCNYPKFHFNAAGDAYKNPDGSFKDGFDGCVKYMKAKGHSQESAEKICGSIAAKKGK